MSNVNSPSMYPNLPISPGASYNTRSFSKINTQGSSLSSTNPYGNYFNSSFSQSPQIPSFNQVINQISPSVPQLSVKVPVPQVSTSSLVPQIPSPSLVPKVPSLVPKVPSLVPSPSLVPKVPSPSLVPQTPSLVPKVPSPSLVSQIPSSFVNPVQSKGLVPQIQSSFVAPVPQISTNGSIYSQMSTPSRNELSGGKSKVQTSELDFEIKDYRGIISANNLEKELINSGYGPLSKIVVEGPNGEKRTQYIKAINMKGQEVYIYVDVKGYTTAKTSDITLVESQSATVVPYSIKTGAYACAGKDICGVAFECGADSVCVLAHGENDLTPKESNFVFLDPQNKSAGHLDKEPTVMSHPVIRLSEIQADPEAVLENTDQVVRKLRNGSYTASMNSLAMTKQSIQKLNNTFSQFLSVQDDVAKKLNSTLTTLEQWNEIYLQNDRSKPEVQAKFRALQHNLVLRNQGITTLLLLMKKVTDQQAQLDDIAQQITDATLFAQQEFQHIDKAQYD